MEFFFEVLTHVQHWADLAVYTTFFFIFSFPCVLQGSERIVYSLCTPLFKLIARWVLRKPRLCALCNICFLSPQTWFFSVPDTVARNSNGPDNVFVAWYILFLYELWWLNNCCAEQGNRWFVHIRSLFLISSSVCALSHLEDKSFPPSPYHQLRSQGCQVSSKWI